MDSRINGKIAVLVSGPVRYVTLVNQRLETVLRDCQYDCFYHLWSEDLGNKIRIGADCDYRELDKHPRTKVLIVQSPYSEDSFAGTIGTETRSNSTINATMGMFFSVSLLCNYLRHLPDFEDYRYILRLRTDCAILNDDFVSLLDPDPNVLTISKSYFIPDDRLCDHISFGSVENFFRLWCYRGMDDIYEAYKAGDRNPEVTLLRRYQRNLKGVPLNPSIIRFRDYHIVYYPPRDCEPECIARALSSVDMKDFFLNGSAHIDLTQIDEFNARSKAKWKRQNRREQDERPANTPRNSGASGLLPRPAENGPKFSFVMIVLNGMPLIEYSLRSIYDFAHEIIIVEGAVQDCMFAANPDGSSKDGTVEFIRSFPDPANKIRLIQGKWPEKCEMQNEALKYVTGNYVWLIDSDEVYKEEDLERIKEILKADSSITQVNFIPDNFWKGLDYIFVCAKFFEEPLHYRRLFKYVPGATFMTHRPPTMLWPGSRKTTEQIHLLDGSKTRQLGIILYHYSYVLDEQVKQKTEYYLRYGLEQFGSESVDGLSRRQWLNECFLKWTPENRSVIEAKYPVWMGDKNSYTEPFKGSHPNVMIGYARRYNENGAAYPSPPVMQNTVDALNEVKEKFPHGCLNIIETGTIRTFHATGQSTYCISEALGDRGQLTSVDISADSIRVSKNFCYDASNIKWIESDSIAYLTKLRDKKFHFAFLDSVNDKDVIFKEFRLLVPMMLENAIIMVDDSGITTDGCQIDHTVSAQKAHNVWHFLESCGAEFDVLMLPNFRGTQLKVTLHKDNLDLIKNKLEQYDTNRSCSDSIAMPSDRRGDQNLQVEPAIHFCYSGHPEVMMDFAERSGYSDISRTYISPAGEVFHGAEADRLLKLNSDSKYLTKDGVVKVGRDRWQVAQSYERYTWMVKALNSKDDRNVEHQKRFDDYRALSGREFEKVIELGCGPFTNLRLMLPRMSRPGTVTLLDPLVKDYLGHPNCPYKDGKLCGIPVQLVPLAIEEFVPSEQYDLVVLINVLEHCFDISKVFNVVVSCLKPGGTLVFADNVFRRKDLENYVNNTFDAGHPLRVAEDFVEDFLSKNFESLHDRKVCGLYDQPHRIDLYFMGRKKTSLYKPTIHFAYSGDPYDDRAIRAPGTITNKLFRFLQQRAQVRYYDWADKTTTVDVKTNDIILGHPNPEEGTIIRRLFKKQCAGKYLIWPLHTRIPEINRYAKELADTADKLFVISGPYWIETIDQTEYAPWKDKIIRLDNAIDSILFPLLKRNFNPVGKRGLFVFGRTGPEKGTKQLFELLCKTNYPVVIAGDYAQSDLQIIENRPNTHVLGRIDWRDPRTTTFILNNCDFFVNMSVSDASPTTLLESMALGLIPITTPECGYSYDSFLLLSLSSQQQNLELLHEAQKLSDDRLKRLQAQNRRIIEHKHTWDKFCETVWQNIRPLERTTGDFIAPQQVDECPTPNADYNKSKKKVLIIRSDSIGDFVIFGGAIPYYRKIYPNAHIAVVVAETVAELAEACPFIDEVISFSRARMCSRPEYAAEFISLIRQKKFDVAICPAFSRDKVSEYIAINSEAAEKITCSADTANLPADIIEANNAHFTKVIPMAEGIALETFRNEEFLRGLGVELDGAYRPAVWVTKADREAAQQLLSRRGIRQPIVVVPFAQLDIRNWPVHNWARLLSMYPDVPVIICGTEKDKQAAEKIVELSNHPNIHNLCGLTTVRQLAALIAQSRLCISGESAAAHLAAVANRPHVVLIGGGHFGRFMPYSSQTKLVYNKMDCYNCNWQCKYGRDIRCIGSISVAMAEQAVNKALGRTKPEPVLDSGKVVPQYEQGIAEKSDYLVSAIVSTYNSEDYIRACLEDLESQTIADRLEIIVVNSGSQQNEEAVIRRFQQKYNNIIYIKTDEREGIYTAWNRAVKLARGQFLTNANTDDRHRPDALEIMASTLQANPDIALVYGDQVRTDTPNDTFDDNRGTEMLHRPDYSRQRLLLGCCVGSQPMWRRSTHKEFGYFDETLTCAGDWDFWLRISSRYEFKHIPEFLGLYYYNEDGIEHGQKIHSLYERYIVGKRYGTPYISVIPLYESSDNPLVSVIMPACNAAEHIAEAIESVLIQNYRNFELVVVNDGSTDDTEDIVAHFKDDKIKYFYKENGGAAGARNAAIKKSRGDFIVNLDTDDMITPDFIAKHLQEVEKHPQADLVYCDDCLINENGKPIRVIERPEYSERRLLIRDLFRCGFPIVPFRTFIRTSVFDKIGLYDEQLSVAEDYDMMRRFVQQNLKVHHLNGALYLRRMTSDSLSRSFTTRNAKSHFDVVRRFADTFAYDELFPDVAWDNIPPQIRPLHAKCLAAMTYLAIGQAYIESNSPPYVEAALERACSELNNCLQTGPANPQVRQLLQKCESVRARYEQMVHQPAC